MDRGRTTTATQQAGRPALDINKDHLVLLRTMSFTWSEMSTILGASVKTLQRRAKTWNISKYSHLTDSQIDNCVRGILEAFPGSGEVMLSGHMKARGIIVQRRRLRESIHRIRGSQVLAPPIQRRVYNVRGPNYLWHADGNHKLIRYRIVIHAAIDGFSRLITYINCADNNRANTVLRYFTEATAEYGMPARIRTDKGGENVDIWRHMVDIRGEQSHPYIAGSSVHNSRIERLWRDVRNNVVSTYATVFRTLEEQNVLDLDNETDLFCLHYVFIPRINRTLSGFQQAWNSHALSSESNWSPLQLFTAYSVGNPLFEEVDPDSYGIDESSTNSESDIGDEEETVSVPRTQNPLSPAGTAVLQLFVEPLALSDSYGADLYMKTIFIVNELLRY